MWSLKDNIMGKKELYKEHVVIKLMSGCGGIYADLHL